VLLAPRHTILHRVLYRYRNHPGSLTFAGDLRDKLSRHLLDIARARLGECRPGTAEHGAYRRWHAWARGYRCIVLVRTGRANEALQTVGAGFSIDTIWAARFLATLPGHWQHRNARRGDVV
jgi:hypothetical protein